MKKTGLLAAAALGFALMLSGCGFTEGTDAVVTVVVATPTPTPAPATPTPEPTPIPTATPEPQPVVEQTPSGINVVVQEGTYVTTDDVNLRPDATTEGDFIVGIPNGTTLHSTGVCDNGWIRVVYPVEGTDTVGYVTGDYVQPAEAPAAEGEAAPAEGAPAEGEAAAADPTAGIEGYAG